MCCICGQFDLLEIIRVMSVSPFLVVAVTPLKHIDSGFGTPVLEILICRWPHFSVSAIPSVLKFDAPILPYFFGVSFRPVGQSSGQTVDQTVDVLDPFCQLKIWQ